MVNPHSINTNEIGQITGSKFFGEILDFLPGWRGLPQVLIPVASEF